MKKQKNFLARAITVAILVAFTIPNSLMAQQPGVKRIDLQRHDLSIPEREMIQARVSIDAGITFPRHSHPGEEIIYVLEGLLEYQLDGKPPIRAKAGDVLFIPAGVIHSAKNIGNSMAAELATYIVKKGKPLLVIIK